MLKTSFNVDRTITIDRPLAEVYTLLGDFHEWPKWSPWLIQEPDCPIQTKGTPRVPDHQMTWSGRLIGAGQIAIADMLPNQNICYDLNIFTPWKSRSKVVFKFKAVGNTTKLTWSMEGHLPIFMFFFKKLMSGLVGSDYERGLAMLKDLLEQEVIHTKIDLHGIAKSDGFYYVGKPYTYCFDELNPIRTEAFQALESLVEKGSIPKPDKIISLRHEHNLITRTSKSTPAYLYNKLPENLPPELEWGHVQSHNTLKVQHIGDYRHSGNGWASATNHQRAEKLKPDKRVPMYEEYVSSPKATDESNLETNIYMPVKL